MVGVFLGFVSNFRLGKAGQAGMGGRNFNPFQESLSSAACPSRIKENIPIFNGNLRVSRPILENSNLKPPKGLIIRRSPVTGAFPMGFWQAQVVSGLDNHRQRLLWIKKREK